MFPSKSGRFAMVLGAALAVSGCTESRQPVEEPADQEQAFAERCATEAPTESERRSMEQTLARSVKAQARAARSVNINVYWHVINNGNSPEQGNITDEQIAQQISVLNSTYAGTPFRFTLAGTDRTTNATWFANENEADMKRALYRRGWGNLNIYTLNIRNGVLGRGSYPFGIPIGVPAEHVSEAWADGVMLLHSTLPGGAAAPYNLGHTATHEVGHWLGLFHTFEGGCSESGDGVGDTSPEASAALGCPKDRDTCAGSGVDPITNFMDYSDDACMNAFTQGQIDRMDSMARTYRGL